MMNYVAGIVSYNRYSKLLVAVESLVNQSMPPQSIVVIENASTDQRYGNLESVFEKSKIPVVVLRQVSNLGGAGGFAQLFEESVKIETDFLLLSDDDVVYNSDYVEQIAGHISKNNSVYVGRAVNNNGDTLQLHYPVDFFGETMPLKTMTFLGVLLPIEAIRKIGVPRAEFFIWEDDREYAQRLEKQGGYRFIGVNNAVVFHDSEAVNHTKVKTDWRTYYGIRNFVYRIKLHENNISGWFKILWKVSASSGITIVAPWRYKGSVKYRFGQIYHGVIDGLNGKLGINKDYFPGKRQK